MLRKIIAIITVVIIVLSLWVFAGAFMDMYQGVKGLETLLKSDLDKRDKLEQRLLKDMIDEKKLTEYLNQNGYKPVKRK